MKVHDCRGNNCVVVCPKCGQVFLVSGFVDRKGRICPKCGDWRVTVEEAQEAWEKSGQKPEVDREQAANRLIFKRAWLGHDVWVTFTDPADGKTYRYPHDQMLQVLMDRAGVIRGTESWEKRGLYHFPRLSTEHRRLLRRYEVKPAGRN